MNDPSVGIVGVGRLGLVVATRLLDAGYRILCCARGRSAELIAAGGELAGDGSPRAVAELADIVLTCLPSASLEAVVLGEDGILSAADRAPVVVELSIAPVDLKLRLAGRLAERGGSLLDCPISGTPDMVTAGKAVIYASSAAQIPEQVEAVLRTISPNYCFVGDLGDGMRLKYVANLLVMVHLAATAEAMALATRFGLDLDMVAELISRSPAAASGQFAVRAPLVAAGRFEGKLVDIRDTREVATQVAQAARDAGMSAPLVTLARELFDAAGARGDDDQDPAKLALLLAEGDFEIGPSS